MSERTIALIEPNTQNGIVVNVFVVPAYWTNPNPGIYLQYDATNPAGIGWEVKNGTVIVPPPPPDVR